MGINGKKYSANPFFFLSKHLPSRVQISTAEKASYSISPKRVSMFYVNTS